MSFRLMHEIIPDQTQIKFLSTKVKKGGKFLKYFY